MNGDLIDNLHSVGAEQTIRAHNRQPLYQALGNEHAVERVAVVIGELASAECMGVQDGQRLNPIAGKPGQDELLRQLRKRESASSVFERHFPRAGSAPVQLICSVSNEAPDAWSQVRIVEAPP